MTKVSLAHYQQLFCDGLLSPSVTSGSEQLHALIQPQLGQSSAVQEIELRVAIYRNNVLHSLRSALGDLYPVVKRLIGDDCFNLIAVEFIRCQPPTSPALLYYGHGLIDYLKRHDSVAGLSYLADVAQLEYAHHIAFHSRDIDALNIAKLATVAPEVLGELVFKVHPSVSLIQSPWAVDTIWHEHIKPQPEPLDIDALGQGNIVVYRQGFDIKIVNLEISCFCLLQQLIQGNTISQAWLTTQLYCRDAKVALDDDELSAMLGYLLNLGVFYDYTLEN